MDPTISRVVHDRQVMTAILRHLRHWPGLELLPPQNRRSFAEGFPWRQELAAWEPGFAQRLPEGLRLPVLYRVDDLGEDRLAVWMEDIDALDTGWDVDRFARAASCSGARRR